MLWRSSQVLPPEFARKRNPPACAKRSPWQETVTATLVGGAMRRIFSIVDIRSRFCNEGANVVEMDKSLNPEWIED